MKDTKTLGSYLPIFTVAIVIIGIIKLTVYYNSFDIPIKYFLGISEIGLYVSEDLLILSLFIFIVFAANASDSLDVIFFKTTNKITAPKEAKEMEIPNPNARTYFSIVFPLFMLTMTMGMTPTSARYIFVSVIILYFITLIYITPSIYSRLKANKSFVITLLTLAIIGYESLAVRSEILGNYKGVYNGTIIELKDKPPFISNDSIFFIGKTSDYLFLYNKKDSTATILPTTSVEKIILKRRTGNFLWNFLGLY